VNGKEKEKEKEKERKSNIVACQIKN